MDGRKSSMTFSVPAKTLGRFVGYCEENDLDPNEVVSNLMAEYLKERTQEDENIDREIVKEG